MAPLRQLDADLWLLELFHGPTLSFKDYALQLVGRLFDRALARRGSRVTVIGATSGDTGSAAIEALQGSGQVEVFILHPRGRVSEVQRRQMTTVCAPNIHNIAIEGTFDDCQDLVKAMFADAAFRAKHRLSAVNSINWARIAAQMVYYVAAAVALGAPARPVAFAVPTGNFGNIFAGWAARRMGVPIDRLVIGSNRNDILTRFVETGEMRMRPVEPSLSPAMDIQVSSNFERLLFELWDRDAARVAATMDGFRKSGAFRGDNALVARMRDMFDAARLDDAGTVAEIRRIHHSTGMLVDPHTAIGVHAARARRRDARVPLVCVATAHPSKFPDAVERATGLRPALPARLADLFAREERCAPLPNDLARVKAYIRGDRMSVETATLPNGLRVVTHRMPHVETVSLGVWVAVGTRHERAEINGVSHFLEHMAFKGTATRSARAIAEEIEAVGGQLNAHTSRELTAFHATVLKEDVGVAVDIIADILQNSAFDEAEIERERVVIAQEIGEARDVPDDVVFDAFQATAYPGQAMGWPILGSEENVAGMARAALVDYMQAHYAAPRMVVAAAGNLDHASFVASAERAFAGLGRARANGAAKAALQGRRDAHRPRRSSRSIWCWASRGSPTPTPTSSPCRSCRWRWAAACRRACSRKSANSAASSIPSIPSPRPTPTPACSPSMPAPASSSLASSCRFSRARWRRSPTRNSPRPSSAGRVPSSRPAC